MMNNLNNHMNIRYKKYKECPYCLSKIKIVYQKLVDRLDTVNDSFDICECTKCGLAFTNPLPVANLGVLYPKNYLSVKDENNNSGINLERLYRYDQYKFDFGIFEKATKLKIGDVNSYLDIGCGSGERVRYVDKQGCRNSCGLDKYDNLKTEVENIYNSEIDKFKSIDKFDVVSMFHVLEHVDSFEAVVQHIKKYIIKKDGYLIIQVPNYGSVEKVIFKHRWFCFDAPRHLWHFDVRFLKKMFEKNGYMVVESQIKNAWLHPISIGASIFKDMDIQRIWVKKMGFFYKILWIGTTLITIPISLMENIFNTSSMLTLILKNNDKFNSEEQP